MTPLDLLLSYFVRRQHGVVSRRQLSMLGFDRGAIERRVRNGTLHRLHRGAYVVGPALVTPRARCLAAVLACGPGAVLSHRSAAALWGIRRSGAGRIDVSVPHTSDARSTATIVVHRSRRPVNATTRDGIPVTTPMQTLADLGTALPRRPLERAAENAHALGLLDLAQVDAAHPGAKRLLEAVEAHDLDARRRGELEIAFLELCGG